MAGSFDGKLKKELGLFDVYAISTGAMFSSGFFLLPGLAAAICGPSVFLAYLCAGFLILPAMFSKAELSTALPRAGGTYFFLDRSMGPMVGTIGGLGTYLALTLKTAFALIGIGAYLVVFIPGLGEHIKLVAVGLTVVFVAINIMGAKETAGLQRILVITLIAVLTLFIIQGGYDVLKLPAQDLNNRFSGFLPNGIEGFVATIGFVFVSYAGLTKVASVAEEVKNPDRNIPLGMMLSLGSTTLIYVVGVFIIVALTPDSLHLHQDLTPVASTARAFTHWIPESVMVGLVCISALAAFASTGNAGVMAASRYPYAMAKDKLMPDRLAELGKHKTPTAAVLLTGAFMIFFILVLDAKGIAKLASAFQLFIFALVNLAVIVMRESQIKSYDPGYKSPFYPWMQIAGVLISLILIISMGWLAILFTIGIILACLIWYIKYARRRIDRRGSIGHWFARLGEMQDDSLDYEFRGIMKEKGLRQDDPFNEVVARASFIELKPGDTFEELIKKTSIDLAGKLGVDASMLESGFMDSTQTGATPVSSGAALPHLHLLGIEETEMVIARSIHGLDLEVRDVLGDEVTQKTHAFFLLVSPEENPAQHLRMLAELANKIDKDNFLEMWNDASNTAHLKRTLMNESRYFIMNVDKQGGSNDLIGKSIMDINLPEDSLVAMVQRGARVIIPRGKTVLQENDRIIIIGEPSVIEELGKKYD